MLILTQMAAQKYLFYRDNCKESVVSTFSKKDDFLEVSLLGVSSKDCIYKIIDWVCPKQEVTSVTTDIDKAWRTTYYDEIMNDFLDENAEFTDEELEAHMLRYSAVWAHTHPGKCAKPSSQDKETYKENYLDHKKPFGSMLILASDYSYTNRMKYKSMFGFEHNDKPVYVEVGDQYFDIQDYLNNFESLQNILGDLSHQTLYEDHSESHEEWLENLKENVAEQPSTTGLVLKNNNNKVSGYGQSVGYTGSHGYYNNYSPNYKNQSKESIKEKIKGWLPPNILDSQVTFY